MTQYWDENLVLAKYHLSITKRLFNNFKNYETKRFLSLTINELAHSSTYLVNSFLIYFNIKNKITLSKNPKQRLSSFKKLSKKILSEEEIQNILKIFQIRKAQKDSPIEFLKKDKIILLDKGKYNTLTYNRLQELINSLENSIKKVPKN